jgi:hypothetical protein
MLQPSDAIRLRRVRKIARESEQLVRDIRWWNENRRDAPPFDCGADVVRATLARRAIGLIEAGKDATDTIVRLKSEIQGAQ